MKPDGTSAGILLDTSPSSDPSSQLLIYPSATSESVIADVPSQNSAFGPPTLTPVSQISEITSTPLPDQMSHLSLKRKSISISQDSDLDPASQGNHSPMSSDRPFKIPHLVHTTNESDHETSSSVPPPSPFAVSTPDKNSIFVNETGVPYQFMVQIDLRNRAEIVQTIKVRENHFTPKYSLTMI